MTSHYRWVTLLSVTEVPMKRILVTLCACSLFALTAIAQQSPADAPASKEDVEKYLQVMHSRDMMMKMIDSMAKPMHQMIQEQYQKNKGNLPPDFEAHMTKLMDDTMKSLPWDEMLDAMVPVYQKHLTKGDVDALVAFYSGPTGQKLIRELPAINAEAMQAMMPMMQKQMQSMTERMQQEVAAVIKQSQDGAGKSKASPN